MILAPRYDGPTILSIDGPPGDTLEPFTRQRRRMVAMVTGLTAEQWAVESRCAGWTAREVVAHLIDVDNFWAFSIRSGLAGTPTRVLSGFDPAASPPQLVARMSDLSAAELCDRFMASGEALLDTIAGISGAAWASPAESPAGLVPVRLVAQHALWDCWVHERDVAVPLGIDVPEEADEITVCLRYAAAVSPVLGLGLGHMPPVTVALEATNPDVCFVVEVDECVTVRAAPVGDLPCLRGEAVDLAEALSLRAPMPAATPAEWAQLRGGLAAAFDAA